MLTEVSFFASRLPPGESPAEPAARAQCPHPRKSFPVWPVGQPFPLCRDLLFLLVRDPLRKLFGFLVLVSEDIPGDDEIHDFLRVV